MENLQLEYLEIDRLKTYENNARKHSKNDVDAIVKSIEQFGFDDPIGIWSSDNIIVEGHGRLEAAKILGLEKVPVIRLDHLTEEERRAYALTHNKTAELSEWDVDLLAGELKGITEIDMSEFGFDLTDLEDIEDMIPEEEELFEDVERLETHYGVPYQGNKSRIADRIISILPQGSRLVDLFGGGGGDNALRYALR